MDIFLIILGILTVIFFILASTNGIKRYYKNNVVIWISSKHKLFGMLASITALMHFIIALSLDELRLTGLLTLIALLITGAMGMLFYKLKKKPLYMVHRIMGPITLILIIIHMILNATT
jgi:DMSO/TMAO reductase YedYZ heme-binding membrane subunit